MAATLVWHARQTTTHNVSTNAQYDTYVHTYVLVYKRMYNNLHIHKYTGTCMHTARNADPAQVSTPVCTQNSSQSVATVILPCNERLPHQECGASNTTGPARGVTADQREACALHTCNNVHSCNHQGMLQ